MKPQFIPYFVDPRVEITLVVSHLEPVRPRHDREVLIVRDPWHPYFPTRDVRRRTRGDRHVDRVHYLSNTTEMHDARRARGLSSHFVNVGCFVDAGVFRPTLANRAKDFDAVIDGRFARVPARDVLLDHAARILRLARDGGDLGAWHNAARELCLPWRRQRELKRHWLASKIERLAILDPEYGTTETADRAAYARAPNCAFSNERRLDPEGVADVINRSHASLAFSKLEGVCRASCESLLCGVPVVTTRSRGGRDVWYDDHNCIVIEPDEERAAEAVAKLRANPRDPEIIRARYLELAAKFRRTFRDDVIEPILRRFRVDASAEHVVSTSLFRWWP